MEINIRSAATSGGVAIKYPLKNWPHLTSLLRFAGATVWAHALMMNRSSYVAPNIHIITEYGNVAAGRSSICMCHRSQLSTVITRRVASFVAGFNTIFLPDSSTLIARALLNIFHHFSPALHSFAARPSE